MDVKEIIKLLNEDFVFEIEAALVYVRNAFIMKECDPSRVTEAIGIDEMRHMNWLADLIVKRGGKPSMEHHELDFGGDDLKGMLARQASLESGAVERYKRHIEVIGDADKEVVGVLRHILDEEKRHRKEFRERLERLK
ncbi:MAG: ferritin-like domain-containing protein [Candidatus Methanoperedens sp.]|jgi:bacterioferritin|nr:ferritin-like domain-containing protein [Candidatus Methanoperedens sp.]PKL54745.1 MAG: ferritin [Candidatus Methanoperedenaceae archaeon HGW-Methanoperedenaceae-1]